MPLTGYTGHVQTEPDGLIYMRGRFYSPAWHVFLNSDQGADPNQANQDAYAGGNPMVNVDPLGMSWLGDAWNDLRHHPGRVFCDPLSTIANWKQDRESVEICAAIAVCVVIDCCTAGAGTAADPGILACVGMGSVPTAVVCDAGVGFVAGGMIGAKNSDWSWKGACEGAIDGAALGYAYNCYSGGSSAFSSNVKRIFAPGGNLWAGIGRGAIVGGVTSVATGSPQNRRALEEFGDGAVHGAITAGCAGMISGTSFCWDGAGIGAADFVGNLASNWLLKDPSNVSNLCTSSAINGPGYAYANSLQW